MNTTPAADRRIIAAKFRFARLSARQQRKVMARAEEISAKTGVALNLCLVGVMDAR